MKVFNGAECVHGSSRQVRLLVAATSRAAAIRALQRHGVFVSANHMAAYWSVTGNASDIALASAQPEQVFASTTTSTRDYEPLPKCELNVARSR